MRTLTQILRRHSWRNRLRPLLFALACLQVLAPATAAIADAWRMDRRQPYAHIEAPGGKDCVLVHDHSCLLCAITTTPQERTASLQRVLVQRGAVAAPRGQAPVATPFYRLRLAPSRAPPAPLA